MSFDPTLLLSYVSALQMSDFWRQNIVELSGFAEVHVTTFLKYWQRNKYQQFVNTANIAKPRVHMYGNDHRNTRSSNKSSKSAVHNVAKYPSNATMIGNNDFLARETSTGRFGSFEDDEHVSLSVPADRLGYTQIGVLGTQSVIVSACVTSNVKLFNMSWY